MNRRERRRRADAEWLLSVRGQKFAAGCWDCCGVGIVVMSDCGMFRLHVEHDPCCPAATGIVPWRAGKGER